MKNYPIPSSLLFHFKLSSKIRREDKQTINLQKCKIHLWTLNKLKLKLQNTCLCSFYDNWMKSLAPLKWRQGGGRGRGWKNWESGREAGILRDKTMADKFMYIPNDDTQNYPFRRLQLVVETFRHSTKYINQSNLIGWFIKSSVHTFLPLILIYWRGNFVCKYWGCTSIYRPLSYPFKSLIYIIVIK